MQGLKQVLFCLHNEWIVLLWLADTTALFISMFWIAKLYTKSIVIYDSRVNEKKFKENIQIVTAKSFICKSCLSQAFQILGLHVMNILVLAQS